MRTATSAVGIANCPGRPTRALVEVTIRHPRRGDLVIELVAPNGSVKRLKAANARDRGVDVIAAYSTSVTVKARNGVWKLRVRDTKRGYAGYIDWWRLTA
jgi:serine protease